MAEKINPNNFALSLGILFALGHGIGVLLLQLGLMQYWSWVHFVDIPYIITQFDVIPFIAGLFTSFIVGVLAGLIFAGLYNTFTKR